MENQERQLYDQLYAHQAKTGKRMFLLVSCFIALFVFIIGVIVFFTFHPVFGIMIMPSGLLFVAIEFINFLIMPTYGNFDRYQYRVDHYLTLTDSDMQIHMAMMAAKNSQLQS